MIQDDKDKHIDEYSGIETTGHEWDGIRELNNPSPRWWVWVFIVTIAQTIVTINTHTHHRGDGYLLLQ